MTELSNRFSPLFSAFVFFVVGMIGFVVIGPIVGTIVAGFFFEGSFMELAQQLSAPMDYPGMKSILMIIQGFATGFGLFLIPWGYLHFVEKKSIRLIFRKNASMNMGILLSFLLIIFFTVVNSLFMEWNASMQLPEFLSGVEAWMKSSEEAAAKITEFMTQFNSTGDFIVALFVIAVLPALGEELVFRGLIQTELQRGFKNPHVAIWISAIMFSAIHMQFYGFIPRMMLGALFGYLYFWSGNMIYPIAAHFFQNGGQLLMMYLVQKETINVDLESNESFPIWLIISFSALTIGVLYYFRKIFQRDGHLETSI